MTERYDDKIAFCRFVPALLLFAAFQFGERTAKSQVEMHTKHYKHAWDFSQAERKPKMNLKEIAYSCYLPAKRKRRRANTCEGYASALRLHVIPRFGSMDLEEITHESIQDWVDGFELPGAAAKAFKTLRQVIRWSIANLGIRIWDPTIGIELPRKPKAENHVLTAEEAATTLRGFWGHELEPAVILSSVLGLRPGETYGMKWSDIDMRSGAVHVRRTLQEVRGLLHVYLPKTEKSERTVYLPRFALDRLRAVWREHGRPKGRVIGAFKPSQVARRIKAWCRQQALPYVSMYQRRHTWATIAVEAGAGIEAVAMMLGHGSINTTAQYYLQPTRKICASVQALVSERIVGA